MNRRTFLKGLGLAVGTPVALANLPLSNEQENQWPDFDPKAEYGQCVKTSRREDPKVREIWRETLKGNMETIVPPRYRHKVEYPECALDYGRYHMLAWHYNPNRRRHFDNF